MATDAARGSGLGKWVVAGLLMMLGAVGLALAGTAPLREPANAAAEFLAANKAKPGVVTTASGLQVEMLRAGEGPNPDSNDFVLVHYEGRLIDGTVFDSSYRRGEPAAFEVSGVIPGWQEGLQMMQSGGKARFTIPSELAYGAAGAGAVIPPNAALVFDVELLGIRPYP